MTASELLLAALGCLRSAEGVDDPTQFELLLRQAHLMISAALAIERCDAPFDGVIAEDLGFKLH
jgi:hypothetical protein